MAIHASRTQTGISWAKESWALFKQHPQKWLLLAFVYILLFTLLPAVPHLQLLGMLIWPLWPAYVALAAILFQQADKQSAIHLAQALSQVKPKLPQLFVIGVACLAYAILMGFVLDSDIRELVAIAQQKASSQQLPLLNKFLPVFFKTMLFMLPLLAATWFAPMLLTLNAYPLVKAIKSSIAGSLKYPVALAAASLLIMAGILLSIILCGLAMVFIAAVAPQLVNSLSQLLILLAMLMATALMFAFQYVSYRDVFRAA